MIERQLKAKAKVDIEQEVKTGNGPLTLDAAAGRYFHEVGETHSNPNATYHDLGRLIEYFKPDRRLDQITDGDVANIIKWRLNQTRWGMATHKDGRPMSKVSNTTVNLSVTKLLRQIFTRARKTWKYQFPQEPNWSAHLLKEPKERIRELHDEESKALEASIREDYAPWLEFARLTGWRFSTTLLQWVNVNWQSKQITNIGKGGNLVVTPITNHIRELLEPLKDHHPVWVFTFVALRNQGGKIKGQRYPITPYGAQTQWRRTIKKAGIKNFKFHDNRHDLATKTLRETGNLKLVSKVLGHSNISTTMRYAAVLDEDVADALTRVADSRKKSRTEH